MNDRCVCKFRDLFCGFATLLVVDMLAERMHNKACLFILNAEGPAWPNIDA